MLEGTGFQLWAASIAVLSHDAKETAREEEQEETREIQLISRMDELIHNAAMTNSTPGLRSSARRALNALQGRRQHAHRGHSTREAHRCGSSSNHDDGGNAEQAAYALELTALELFSASYFLIAAKGITSHTVAERLLVRNLRELRDYLNEEEESAAEGGTYGGESGTEAGGGEKSEDKSKDGTNTASAGAGGKGEGGVVSMASARKAACHDKALLTGHAIDDSGTPLVVCRTWRRVDGGTEHTLYLSTDFVSNSSKAQTGSYEGWSSVKTTSSRTEVHSGTVTTEYEIRKSRTSDVAGTTLAADVTLFVEKCGLPHIELVFAFHRVDGEGDFLVQPADRIIWTSA